MTTQVWISPSATSFSCLCEPCLEQARCAGLLFSDALMRATLRGAIPVEAATSVVRCAEGHEVVLRRIERPPTLSPRNAGQLSLV